MTGARMRGRKFPILYNRRMALSPGATYSIVKPSFWHSRREVRNASNVLLGYYQHSGWTQSKAEAEAHGRKLIFSYKGWDNRNARMTDMSGNVLATFEAVGWIRTQFKLTYGGREYAMKLNGWGTTFSIFDGETEVLRVTPGGYFKPGTITVHTAIEEKEMLALVFFGLYEQYQIMAAASAAGSAGVAGAVVISN